MHAVLLKYADIFNHIPLTQYKITNSLLIKMDLFTFIFTRLFPFSHKTCMAQKLVYLLNKNITKTMDNSL